MHTAPQTLVPQAQAAAAMAAQQHVPTISFSTFVAIFMSEPAPGLKTKEVGSGVAAACMGACAWRRVHGGVHGSLGQKAHRVKEGGRQKTQTWYDRKQ